MRDDDVRSSLFASLDVLCAKHGPEVPCRAGLDAGFAFRGGRVPFLNFQKGIYRAAAQRGPAALSVNTSFRSPYDDEETSDGFAYAYRAGPIDQPDNRALRAAHDLQVPLAYFIGTRPGWYRPEWPVFVTSDDPSSGRVTLTPGRMIGPLDEREPLLPADPIERRYAVRETRVRIHRRGFGHEYFLLTPTSAQSVASRKDAFSMRRTSSLTSSSPASRRSATVSVSARSTTVHTTSIWSACPRTTALRCIPGCSMRPTDRCWRS